MPEASPQESWNFNSEKSTLLWVFFTLYSGYSVGLFNLQVYRALQFSKFSFLYSFPTIFSFLSFWNWFYLILLACVHCSPNFLVFFIFLLLYLLSGSCFFVFYFLYEIIFISAVIVLISKYFFSDHYFYIAPYYFMKAVSSLTMCRLSSNFCCTFSACFKEYIPKSWLGFFWASL